MLGSLSLVCLAAEAPAPAAERRWETEVPREKVPFITAQELEEKHRQWENPILLDVREPQFWFDEHVPAAGLFPSEALILNWEHLPKDKNKEIIVYCTRPGCPSAFQAAQLMVWHGYTHVKENFLLLDTRSEQEYRQGHIATAILFPTAKIEKEWNTFSKDQEIIVYCGGQGCALSRKAAKILMWHGFQKVSELNDGTHAWQLAGFTLVPGDQP